MIFETRRINLNRIRVEAEECISGEALHNLTLSKVEDDMSMHLWLKLRTEILAEKLQETTKVMIIEVPTSWWQMLKRDVFPKWFIALYPVKNRTIKDTVTFTRFAKFPTINRVFPRDKPIMLEFMEEVREQGTMNDLTKEDKK